MPHLKSIGASAFSYSISWDDGTEQYCDSLKRIGDISNVEQIGDSAFFSCASLAEIGSLQHVTTIGDWAFGYCTSLKEISSLDNIKKIALALNVLTDDLLSPVNILKASNFDKEKMEYWEPEYFTESHTLKLNAFFKRLNVFGQEKAIEQVELLTKIPEYTEKIESRELEMYHRKEELERNAAPPDQDEPEALDAANDRGATPEEKKNADDIMHNPDEWE